MYKKAMNGPRWAGGGFFTSACEKIGPLGDVLSWVAPDAADVIAGPVGEMPGSVSLAGASKALRGPGRFSATKKCFVLLYSLISLFMAKALRAGPARGGRGGSFRPGDFNGDRPLRPRRIKF